MWAMRFLACWVLFTIAASLIREVPVWRTVLVLLIAAAAGAVSWSAVAK